MDQIAHYLEQAPLVEAFIKDLQQLAHGLLESGAKVPGWKLVNKRATRQWTNDDKAVAFMTQAGVEAWAEPKPLSPAQAEKALKKAKIELPADLIVAVSSGSPLRRKVIPASGLANRTDAYQSYVQNPVTEKVK
jgi:hypothetical protein